MWNSFFDQQKSLNSFSCYGFNKSLRGCVVVYLHYHKLYFFTVCIESLLAWQLFVLLSQNKVFTGYLLYLTAMVCFHLAHVVLALNHLDMGQRVETIGEKVSFICELTFNVMWSGTKILKAKVSLFNKKCVNHLFQNLSILYGGILKTCYKVWIISEYKYIPPEWNKLKTIIFPGRFNLKFRLSRKSVLFLEHKTHMK